MTNEEIKSMIYGRGFKLWQVAEKLGVTDATFSRRLRKPFSDEDVEKVKSALKTLEEERLAALTR